jgi:glycerol kinase
VSAAASARVILALDQGTHASRALLIDRDGNLRSAHRRDVSLRRPRPRHVEQHAGAVLDSLRNVIAEALDHASHAGLTIECAGLATQRSTVVAWSRPSGEALAPALSWLDTRADLQSFTHHAADIEGRTGLRLSPHYGAGKLCWLLRHSTAVREAANSADLALGPLASFLLFNLVEGRPFVADHANAHRTLLMNLETRDWDESLTKTFGIAVDHLPRSVPVRHAFGALRGTDIPLTACGGDQGAAVHAYGAPDDGIAINAGTGAFILATTGEHILRRAPLLSGLVASDSIGATYCLEGTVNGAGAAITYANDRWGCDAAAWSGWKDVAEPPTFLNTVGGLGSPWWRPGPAPRLEATQAPHAAAVAAAIMESIVFLIQANLELLRDAVQTTDALRLTGGLARDDAFCQRLADISGLPVARPKNIEATGRGIAWLAAGGAREWAEAATRFEPVHDRALVERYRRFRQVVDGLPA